MIIRALIATQRTFTRVTEMDSYIFKCILYHFAYFIGLNVHLLDMYKSIVARLMTLQISHDAESQITLLVFN
jgi:hypothetical protein